MSLPMRECVLKPLTGIVFVAPSVSLPMRERVLKRDNVGSFGGFPAVAPHAGACVETAKC